MRSRRRPEGAADIAEVRARIDRWRTMRTKRSPMPAPLWDAAVRLAQTHGLYPIARGLAVNYESLKGRAVATTPGSEPRAATRSGARFVEWRPLPLPPGAAAPPTGPWVELVDPRGATLTMRLGSGEGLDVVGLARAFWDRRA